VLVPYLVEQSYGLPDGSVEVVDGVGVNAQLE